MPSGVYEVVKEAGQGRRPIKRGRIFQGLAKSRSYQAIDI